MNLVQSQMVEMTNCMNRDDVEHAEAATKKEKSLITLDVDNVKKGEGNLRGGGSSSRSNNLRGGSLTGTISKRKAIEEGSCRPAKRGGGRGGDRGGGSGGRGGRAPSGGRAIVHQFRNLMTGEGFADPNVKRKG
ncbi:probable H/ACA ribonucleoprotein complex subunit 1-like protein [Impatiens glandulifera]|uniref:probable H/ACA ribonucleoprotein complex subunit 1-like protein n=1 Tax=Impatiens glandulifera TaxID=253017 RepID=UPI001FB1008D|nr:probable H/ACA ribonucleoprotein complex subunit 1-like protein [Impatiens glandulifera]